MEDGRLFAFAGIWDRWKHNDRTIISCAILTTTANELLSTIHHRMPVILNPESYALWLDENSRSTDLKEILVPFPAKQMKSHPVSYYVNDVKIDHEGLLRPVTPNIGVNLSLF
jgi:putative SOS response-associated peptidase YedK